MHSWIPASSKTTGMFSSECTRPSAAAAAAHRTERDHHDEDAATLVPHELVVLAVFDVDGQVVAEDLAAQEALQVAAAAAPVFELERSHDLDHGFLRRARGGLYRRACPRTVAARGHLLLNTSSGSMIPGEGAYMCSVAGLVENCNCIGS
ncbi:hypothetical protein PR003_g13681 [Phytophthora rubi]|uniref:Uncharacterized protein n=1 Tax=Phytophthora rubi TaxID=129364 RepID=A0A6A4FEM3_9STRA|nr:hypothetical protein PR003_g13681 [Phytophthora rubi]